MKLLVVYKRSAYERYCSDANVCTFVEGTHPDAVRIRKSHDAEKSSIRSVIDTLRREGYTFDSTAREDLESVKGYDKIITVGGDGTFLDVSHFIHDETPILGINSNPAESTGFLCTATADNFLELLNTKATKVQRLQLILDGKKLPEQVLNDVLIAHSNPAATTRYVIKRKEFKGSGLLISAPSGSTGWMYQEGAEILPLHSKSFYYLSRGVRNERPRKATSLAVSSLTRNGTIFIDGTHVSYLFGLGQTLTVEQGTPLHILGNLEEKQQKFI